MFEGLELTKLYDTEDEYSQNYIFGELTDDLISRAEANIGYKLPKSYIELLRFQNGGYISDDIDSWLTAIYGIGPETDTPNSLEEMFPNWMEEWEYPKIGIPFGETQSGGHDMYFMDYRNLDENGEPAIVLVDVEMDPEGVITPVAKNLREFIEKVLNGQMNE